MNILADMKSIQTSRGRFNNYSVTLRLKVIRAQDFPQNYTRYCNKNYIKNILGIQSWVKNNEKILIGEKCQERHQNNIKHHMKAVE